MSEFSYIRALGLAEENMSYSALMMEHVALQARCRDLQLQLDYLAGTVEVLTKERDALAARLAEIEKERDFAVTGLTVVERRRDELKARLAEAEAEIERLRHDLQRALANHAKDLNAGYAARAADSAPAVCPNCQGRGWTGLGNPCRKCNAASAAVAHAHEWFRLTDWPAGQFRCYACGQWQADSAAGISDGLEEKLANIAKGY